MARRCPGFGIIIDEVILRFTGSKRPPYLNGEREMALFERRSAHLLGLLLALSLGFSACSDDDSDGPDSIDRKLTGELSVTPSPITFETVGLNDETSVTLMLSNSGQSTLRITNIALKEDVGPAPLDMQEEFFKVGEGWGPQDLKLEPGMMHSVVLSYRPINEWPDTGTILIESNDPGKPRFTIPITTQGLTPKIFSPATVSFPRVTPPGPDSSTEEGPWRGAWKMTQVQNTGAAPPIIKAIAIRANNSRFS